MLSLSPLDSIDEELCKIIRNDQDTLIGALEHATPILKFVSIMTILTSSDLNKRLRNILMKMCPQANELSIYNNYSRILDYIQGILEYGVAQKPNVKLFFLGNTFAGKTSLVNKLRGMHDSLTASNDRTRVLEVNKLILSDENENNYSAEDDAQGHTEISIKHDMGNIETNATTSKATKTNDEVVNIYDSAGQSEYVTMTSLMVHGQCYFILVIDGSKDVSTKKMYKEMYNSSTSPYINMVCNTNGASIVYIVISKADKMTSENKNVFENLKQDVQEQIEFMTGGSEKVMVRDVHFTSVKDGTGVNDLKQMLLSDLKEDKLEKSMIPGSWMFLLSKLKDSKKSRMSYNEVVKQYTDISSIPAAETVAEEDRKVIEDIRSFIERVHVKHQEVAVEQQADIGTKNYNEHDGMRYSLLRLSNRSSSERNTTPEKDMDDNRHEEILKTRKDEPRKEVDSECEKTVNNILNIFTRSGDIVWFDKSRYLKNVYLKPEKLVEMLRMVLVHDLEDVALRSGKVGRNYFLPTKMKGLLEEDQLEKLYDIFDCKEKEESMKDEVIYLLQHLNIVWRHKEGPNKGDFFVPSLISHDHLQSIKSKITEFNHSANIIGALFEYKRADFSQSYFQKILVSLGDGITFGGGYSRKVDCREEDTKDEIINGMIGTLMVAGEVENKSFKHEIIMTENEVYSEKYIFPVCRVIQILLKPEEEVNRGVWNFIRELNEIVRNILEEDGKDDDFVDRRILCPECCDNGHSDSYFFTDADFKIKKNYGRCSKNMHAVGAIKEAAILRRIKVQTEKTRIEHDALFKKINDAKDEERMSFDELKEKIESKTIRKGDQLLIKGNVGWAKYAHVMLYTGQSKEDEPEIVHVQGCRKFPRLGTVRCESIQNYLKRKGEYKKNKKNSKKLFILGHQVPSDHVFGLRKQITNLAKECATQNLIFDYNYKSNCETFSNALMGDLSLHNIQQGPSDCCCKCIFSCLKVCRCCCRKPMLEEIKKVIDAKDKEYLILLN